LGDPVNFYDPLGMNPYKDYPKNGGPGDANDQPIIDAKDRLAKGGKDAREAARKILEENIRDLKKDLKGACGKARTQLLRQIRALEAFLKTGFRAPSSPLIIIIIDPNTGLPVGMPKLPGETEIY
jgi:hypothetical protein